MNCSGTSDILLCLIFPSIQKAYYDKTRGGRLGYIYLSRDQPILHIYKNQNKEHARHLPRIVPAKMSASALLYMETCKISCLDVNPYHGIQTHGGLHLVIYRHFPPPYTLGKRVAERQNKRDADGICVASQQRKSDQTSGSRIPWQRISRSTRYCINIVNFLRLSCVENDEILVSPLFGSFAQVQKEL